MVTHSDFTFRRPTPDDAQAIVDMINAGDIAATGLAQTDLTSLHDQWNAPYFVVDRDAWVAATSDGRLAGYLECIYEPGEEDVGVFFYVHPDFADTNLAATLLAMGEQHAPVLAATAPEERPYEILTAFYANEAGPRRLVEANGYTVVRFFYRMDIRFDAPPPPVPLVDGVVFRDYTPQRDDVAFYEALEDSFKDHWRHRYVSYDEWRAAKIDVESYDPTLWMVAEADGEIVGGAVGMLLAGVPWIRMLGVRREWRKRGIARAILTMTFQKFYRLGYGQVGLGVDASSSTGATRLYESAGMYITDERVVYTKPLPV